MAIKQNKRVLLNDEDVKIRRKEYFEKLLNEKYLTKGVSKSKGLTDLMREEKLWWAVLRVIQLL